MGLTKRELKPEQAAAAYTLDRHISVTAGPGAGKTTVLVERYLHILRKHQNLNIDQIVAITFTNRAANEMRERLREELDRLLQTAPAAERARWVGYKRTLEGAVITTIHGFCARLLRDFPIESAIDPQFVLLDEHQAAVLLEAAVEEALTEFITSGHENVSRLTVGVGRGRLADALAEIYRVIRGEGLSIKQLDQLTGQRHSTWKDYLAAFENIDASMNALISAGRLTSSLEEKRSAAARGWPSLRQKLLDENLPLGEFCRLISEFRQSVRPSARPPIAQIIRQLDEDFWGEAREKGFGLVPRIRFDLFARNYAHDLIKVVESVDKRLEKKKQQLAAIDFDDLQLRVLRLLKRPEVLRRATNRHRFFLVDEFQDTNNLQRELMDYLALKGRRANLFIVGDRKQSIYGFRGADVDVFRDMTATLVQAGGESKPLHLNFRSQPPLIDFFNLLFKQLFNAGSASPKDLAQLGYVEHDLSVAERATEDESPLVELMVATQQDDPEQLRPLETSRELDAKQLAWRIISIVNEGSGESGRFKYRDIALLFRALSDVPVYEAQFRRAQIPFQTVQGKGFYDREEITDLIQLLRFLDNATDELALAAILRSPFFGISDNSLLALRTAPNINHQTQLQTRRKLIHALQRQKSISFISDEERLALDRAWIFLRDLLERKNRFGVGDLLRYAVERSEYATVISATYDGAQRLANVQKLFSLAERFERSGAHLIRDFVRYVRDFEAIGGRESEGEIDESANAVKLMTIHQAKGLEFPVVVIPDLHRSLNPKDSWLLLDRHLGLTLRVPDGRGEHVAGTTFRAFNERAKLREQFESTRLLYVAATRARDRLIFSGVTEELTKLEKGNDSWLKLIWQGLELQSYLQTGTIQLSTNVQLRFTLNLSDEHAGEPIAKPTSEKESLECIDIAKSPEDVFTLLKPLRSELEGAVHRFSVTQLLNYKRCPRQYYFDRILHVPKADEIGVWNDAEAPEPTANLTATLKGAVIHRFCETYVAGTELSGHLRQCFLDVVSARPSTHNFDPDLALKDLLPLAQNYLASDVFKRIESARRYDHGLPLTLTPGLWSELSFRLRRPLGILTGTVDKLLISHRKNNETEIEIIDFKTNRVRARERSAVLQGVNNKSEAANQLMLDFSGRPHSKVRIGIYEQVSTIAAEYQLQMQAYLLAIHELLPKRSDDMRVKVTLHFLEPNVEFQLNPELLEPDRCAQDIDEAMLQIAVSSGPQDFQVLPGIHCRLCSFLSLCPPGRQCTSDKL